MTALVVDLDMVKGLKKTPLSQEQVAKLEATVLIPERPWHKEKLQRFLVNLAKQSKE